MSSHTTNHRYDHDAHEVHMATELAPGPPMPPRRRVRVTIVEYLQAVFTGIVLVAFTAIGLMLIGFALTGDWPRF